MAFKVYINGYLDEDGNIIESSSDVLMFEVPLTDTSPVSDPSVKSQVGMADSFDFSMEVNSDYYDNISDLLYSIIEDINGNIENIKLEIFLLPSYTISVLSATYCLLPLGCTIIAAPLSK